MAKEPKIALFQFGYLINVPPLKQELFIDNDDILLKWVSLGWHTMPDQMHNDNTAQGGFFIVPGLTIKIEDFVYMHRWINIQAPGAGPWLEQHEWNYDRTVIGYVHKIVFKNGWQLETASQHKFDDVWSPRIADNRIALLENSAVNLEYVSKVTSFRTNLADYVQFLTERKEQE